MIPMSQRFTAFRARQNRKGREKPAPNMSVAGAFGSVILSAHTAGAAGHTAARRFLLRASATMASVVMMQ
jgi:hypothetical protein